MLCIVENLQVKNDKRSYVPVCTECDVDGKLMTGKPDGYASKKGATKVSTVQPT